MVFGQRAEDRDAPGRLGGVKDFVGGHSVLHLLPNDPKHVLIATYRSNKGREQISEAALLDIYTGRLRTVAYAPLRDAMMLADNNGVVRFALGRNKDFEFEVHYRRDAKTPWQRVAATSFGEGQLLPIAFADAPNKVYVIDNRASDTNALSLLDLDSGAVQELFHDARVDLDRAALSEPDRVLYAARYVPGTIEYYVIDDAKPYAAILRAALARFPNSSIDITSSTRARDRALVHVVSDRNPGTFYEFDARDVSFKRLLTARRWLDPERLAPVTPVIDHGARRTTAAGLSNARHRRERRRSADRDAARRTVRRERRAVVRRDRAAVRAVRVRGVDGQLPRLERLRTQVPRGRFRTMGRTDPTRHRRRHPLGHFERRRRSEAHRDLRHQLRRLFRGDERDAGTRPLSVRGGGFRYLRPAAAARHRETSGGAPPAVRSCSRRSATTAPNSNGTHRYSNAARIKVPLFIAHGSLDVRAPVEHARELRDAMAAQGRPVAYLEKAHEGHGFYDEDNRTELYERVLAFIGQYLNVASPASTVTIAPFRLPNVRRWA